jgi:hypothetical protein
VAFTTLGSCSRRMDDQELYAEVQRKLVQSGEWDRCVESSLKQLSPGPEKSRILDLLRSKANEASFLDDATHRAKGIRHSRHLLAGS